MKEQRQQCYKNGLSGDWDVNQVTKEATLPRNREDALAVELIVCLPFQLQTNKSWKSLRVAMGENNNTGNFNMDPMPE